MNTLIPAYGQIAAGLRTFPDWRAAWVNLLERGLRRHPVFTTAGVLALTGCAMVCAVAALTLGVMLPVCALAGIL